MEAVESFVQVAPDGSGKKMRNIAMTVLVDDGAGGKQPATVMVEVIAIADENGKPLRNPSAWEDGMLEEIHKSNELLTLILARLG